MKPVFIDFEASGLGPDSWPIEIGFAWIEGRRVQSASRLIRPDPGWSSEAWSPASAAIHGIPRSALDAADPAADVARWATSVIGVCVLISDAPEFDQRWLDRLISVAPTSPCPIVLDFDEMVARRFRFPAIERIYDRLDREATVHRAEADARKLARAWLVGIRGEDLA